MSEIELVRYLLYCYNPIQIKVLIRLVWDFFYHQISHTNLGTLILLSILCLNTSCHLCCYFFYYHFLLSLSLSLSLSLVLLLSLMLSLSLILSLSLMLSLSLVLSLLLLSLSLTVLLQSHK